MYIIKVFLFFPNKIPTKLIHKSALLNNGSISFRLNKFFSTISIYPALA